MRTSSEMNAAVSGCLIVMTESSDVVSTAVSKWSLSDWSDSESNAKVSCSAGSHWSSLSSSGIVDSWSFCEVLVIGGVESVSSS